MNFILAAASAPFGFFSQFLTAHIFTPENIPFISGIILPCVFFAIGKGIDILWKMRQERRGGK